MYRIGNKRGTSQCRASIVGEKLKETNEGMRQIIVVIVPHNLIVFVREYALKDGLVECNIGR